MTTTQAKAEIFWTAFRFLKRNEREAIIEKIMNYPTASSGVSKRKMFSSYAASGGELNPERLKDKTVREDLRYALVIEDRKNEPQIYLNDYLPKSK